MYVTLAIVPVSIILFLSLYFFSQRSLFLVDTPVPPLDITGPFTPSDPLQISIEEHQEHPGPSLISGRSLHSHYIRSPAFTLILNP